MPIIEVEHFLRVNFSFQKKGMIVDCFFSLFSEKQTIRPTSILTCCKDVIPILKQKFLIECWKSYFIALRMHNPVAEHSLQRDIRALKTLNKMKNAFVNKNENDLRLSCDDSTNIENFLSKEMTECFFFKALGIFNSEQKY